MTSYMVRIEGRGIDFVVADRLASVLGFIGLGRSARCVGFFTTRYVESNSESAAAQLAQQQVTDELLKKKVVSIEDLDQLNLRIDEIAVVTAGQRTGPNEGFTFFEQ